MSDTVKQVNSVNQDDELAKDEIALANNDDDPDSAESLDIDEARKNVGETNDGDWEHRNQLSDDNLNLNNDSELSTVDPRDPDELEDSE